MRGDPGRAHVLCRRGRGLEKTDSAEDVFHTDTSVMAGLISLPQPFAIAIFTCSPYRRLTARRPPCYVCGITYSPEASSLSFSVSVGVHCRRAAATVAPHVTLLSHRVASVTNAVFPAYFRPEKKLDKELIIENPDVIVNMIKRSTQVTRHERSIARWLACYRSWSERKGRR